MNHATTPADPRSRGLLSYFLTSSEFQQIEVEREGKEVRRVTVSSIAPSFLLTHNEY